MSNLLFKGFMGINVFVVGYAIKEFLFQIKIVKTDELKPILEKNDIVLISRSFKAKNLKNEIVLIKNPYNNTERFSYVVGNEADWIKHQNFNTLVRVPTGSIWSEPGILSRNNEKMKNSTFASFSNFIDSQSFVQGRAKYIFYPFERRGSVQGKPELVEGKLAFSEQTKIDSFI